MEISSIQGQVNYQNFTSNVESGSKTPEKETKHIIEKERVEHIQKQEVSKKETDHTKQEKIKEKLKSLTEKLNKEMEPLNTSVKFGFDEKVDEMVVNVIDTKTDKVIRKIPSDEALKLMAKMREIVGMLFDTKG